MKFQWLYFFHLNLYKFNQKKKIIFEKNFSFTNSDDKKEALKRRYIDLVVDKEQKQILYCYVDDGQLKVFSINFDDLYQTILSKQKEEDDSEDEEESKNKKKKKKKKF